MDKINTANWNNYFEQAQQKVLYASDRYTEFSVCFDEPRLATGNMKAIVMPGMMLGELHVTADKPFQLMDNEAKETAESVFVLKGDVESRFHNLKQPLQFGRQNHNLQYNTQFAGEHTIYSKEFHAITITYDIAWLKTLVQPDTNGSLSQLNKSLERKTNFLATPHSTVWQHRIGETIHAIRHCALTGLAGYIFIESKMMELFVLQMEHFNQVNGGSAKEKWTTADKEKLYAVKAFVGANYLEPLSLKELISQFGLNEFKLKKGYRHFFQSTVFGHIHELRMQHAKTLLRERQMNVTEAAYFIGYKNVSSFSYEFKKRYGYTPGMFLQQD